MSSLEEEYAMLKPAIQRMGEEIVAQLEFQLEKELKLRNPVKIESRIKSLSSISEKIARKQLRLKSVTEVSDLFGIRIIVTFGRELKNVESIINKAFQILQFEDTSQRLIDRQFGYQSLHYNVKLREDWLNLPKFEDCGAFQIEIQVRTLAQHLWAVATHGLQYKNERSVPISMSRSIFRVAALLETVDLEFERVLAERDEYLDTIDTEGIESALNSDNLARILAEMLPAEFRSESENYSELIEDLIHFGIDTKVKVVELISGSLDEALDHQQFLKELEESGDSEEWCYYGSQADHCGMVTYMLSARFPDEWRQYSAQKAFADIQMDDYIHHFNKEENH